MAVAEWETAHCLNFPITYVVLDNTFTAWIKLIQHLYVGGRYFAVDPKPVDPVLLGSGVAEARARILDELAALAKRAVDAASPIDHPHGGARTHGRPPVTTWQAALSRQQTTRPIH